jgi:acyl-coenzyme A thioesterase PaaI-like protein
LRKGVTATALHLGGGTATYEVVVTDEQNRRLCTARITCMIREPMS